MSQDPRSKYYDRVTGEAEEARKQLQLLINKCVSECISNLAHEQYIVVWDGDTEQAKEVIDRLCRALKAQATIYTNFMITHSRELAFNVYRDLQLLFKTWLGAVIAE